MGLPRPGSEDTGRKGYIEADEPWDGSDRPRVRIVEPFWTSESERLEYEDAVQTNPRGIGEGSLAYVARLSAIVTERLAPLTKPMPRARPTRRERDAELAKLRQQEREIQARDAVVGER